jgi:hypothetical protein
MPFASLVRIVSPSRAKPAIRASTTSDFLLAASSSPARRAAAVSGATMSAADTSNASSACRSHSDDRLPCHQQCVIRSYYTSTRGPPTRGGFGFPAKRKDFRALLASDGLGGGGGPGALFTVIASSLRYQKRSRARTGDAIQGRVRPRQAALRSRGA